MVDIDERVVQMKFDNSDFEKKSKSTFKILDTLKEKLSFKNVGDQENINAIERNLEKVATKAYSIFDRLQDKIMDSLTNKLFAFLRDNTIGQIEKGWGKYAEMTTAVATLKAQGYALETINEQLERLNYFTDETSYNFTAMVTEIGKFTASGQSLEDATTAMMGIAEWASLSGKNANEATRAMYQLSQALGSGKMRKEDWKSIQNLNMDTKEFRQNAIDAAIELGTLKEEANGTYTTLVGKKANKLNFSLQQFADNLTEGEWFTSDVMMKVYSEYSSAVDTIKEYYDEGGIFDRTLNKVVSVNTTAEVVDVINKNNADIKKKFEKTQLKSKDVDNILKKWSKVKVITDDVVDDYAEANKLTKEIAKTQLQQNLDEYVKEYADLFKGSAEEAIAALKEWEDYVPEFGMKAFKQAQEAKTFQEAIDSAKDAASTAWTTIFTTIFGDYDEARALWTDLANSLYDIFVGRLWDIADIFEYWKNGEAKELMSVAGQGYNKELKELQKQLEEFENAHDMDNLTDKENKFFDSLSSRIRELTAQVDNERYINWIKEWKAEYAKLSSQEVISDADHARMTELMGQIEEMQAYIDKNSRNGRTLLFQGLYTFGAGFKSIIENFREAWDSLFEENSAGKSLLDFTERFRKTAFRFYRFMQELGETDFFVNIATALKNILDLFSSFKNAILAGLAQVLPQGTSIQSVLVRISEIIKNVTEFLKPSPELIQRIARISRGFFASIKGIAKIIYALWKFIEPAVNVVIDVLSNIINIVGEFLATIGDLVFGIEEGANSMDDLGDAGAVVGTVFGKIKDVILGVVGVIRTFFGPVIEWVGDRLKDIGGFFKGLFGEGSPFDNIKNSFKGFKDRLNKAMEGTESFASIFNKYKNGSGLTNFLGLVGDLASAAVSKLGTLIATIFGVEDAVKDGKLPESLQNIKDVFATIGVVLKWIWTNLIKPIFTTIITGVRASMDEIIVAFKEGNVTKLLEIFGKILKSVFSLEIINLIRTFTKVMGSGGLLKCIRELAKTIHSVGKYFNAKAFEARSNGILKIAISLAILTSVIVGLTVLLAQLNPETIAKMKDGLIMIAGAMGIIVVSLIGLSVAIRIAGSGFLYISIMLTTFAASLALVAFTLFKINSALNALSDSEKGGFALVFETISGMATGLIGVMTALRLIGGKDVTNALLGIGAAMAGLGIALAGFALALSMVAEVVSKYDFLTILGALSIVIVAIVSLSFAARIMSKSISLTITSGLGVAMGVLGMVAAFAWFIMPILEDLAMKSDDFGKYAIAMALLAGMMITIAGSIALINASGNGLTTILSTISFGVFVAFITNDVVPLLDTISKYKLYEYKDGLVTFSWFMGVLALSLLAIGGAINLIFSGISKIAWKTMIVLIGGVVATVIGIMNLADQLKGSDDLMEKLTPVFAAFGLISSVLLVLALFMHSVEGSITKETGDNVIKALEMMFGIILSIGVTLNGMVALSGTLFKGNLAGLIATYSGITVMMGVVIGMIGGMFSKLIKSIGGAMMHVNLNSGSDHTKNIVAVLQAMFKMIVAIGAILATFIAEIGLIYATTDIGPVGMSFTLAFVGALLPVTIGVLGNAFSKLMKALGDSMQGVSDNRATEMVKALEIMLGIIAAIGATLAVSLALIGATYTSGMEWMGGLNAALIAGSMIAIIIIFSNTMESIYKILNKKGLKDDKQFKKFKTTLIVFGALISGMFLTIGTTIGIMSQLTKTTGIVKTLVNAVIIVGVFAALVFAFTKAMSNVIESLNNIKNNDNGFKGLIAICATMVASMLTTIGIISALDDVNVEDLRAAISVIGIVISTVWILAHSIENLLEAFKENGKLTGNRMAILIGFMVTTLLTLAMLGTVVIPAMRNLENVPWNTALAAVGSISLLLLSIGGMLKLMKSSDLFQGDKWDTITKLGTVFVSLASIALFMPRIFNSLKILNDVDFSSIVEGLGSIIVIIGSFIGVVKLLDVFEAGIKDLGLALLALAGPLLILDIFKDSIVGFFRAFNNVSWSDWGMGLATLGVMIGIVALMVAFGPAIGAALTAAIVPILEFCGVLALLSLTLMLVSKAIMMFKEALGIGVETKTLEKAGTKSGGLFATRFNRAFAKKEKINSPSKVFKQYGKFIDQGLSKGITENMNIVYNASEELGNETNDAFCDALGIASPSKVFYENGRFVVRGFINGASSQNDKLNALGNTIGDSVVNGITDSFANMDLSSQFDLWGGRDPEEVISEGIDGLGDSLIGGLWDKIMGNDSYRYDTEWRKVTNENIAEWNAWLEGKEREKAALEKQIGGKESDAYKALEDEISNARASGKFRQRVAVKTNSGIKGVITGALSGLIGDGTISDKLGELWNWVTDKFQSFFGTNGEGSKVLGETAQEVVKKIDTAINGESATGDGTTNGLISNAGKVIEKKFGSIESLGARAGNALVRGVISALGPIGSAIENALAGTFIGNLLGISKTGEITEDSKKVLDVFENKMNTELANTVFALKPDMSSSWYNSMLSEANKKGLLSIDASGIYSISEKGLKDAAFAGFLTTFEEIGSNDGEGYTDSFLKTFKNGTTKILETYDQYVAEFTGPEHSNQNSPSKLWGSFGKYDAEGYELGFTSQFDQTTKSVLNNIDDMYIKSKESLGVMTQAIDDETIQPRITPVFDGVNIQNGITGINSAFDSMSPAIEATMESFGRDMPNYDDKFDILAASIAGTNSMLDSLMTMLAEGDIVTVNVNAEENPDNLYNLIVNTNRQNFKRTGRNQLAF